MDKIKILLEYYPDEVNEVINKLYKEKFPQKKEKKTNWEKWKRSNVKFFNIVNLKKILGMYYSNIKNNKISIIIAFY